MSNRFHNKFHRHNHHTNPTDRQGLYPDSAYDPIASSESPFQGDFYLSGNFIALSSVVISGHTSGKTANFTDVVMQNLTVLGETTQLDTYVFSSSSVDITNAGTGPGLRVAQTGNAPIAYFVDTDGDNKIIFDTDGNVGIGTQFPAFQLHVQQLDITQNAVASIDSLARTGQLTLKGYLGGEVIFKSGFNDYANIIGSSSLSSLSFKTCDAERVTIKANGNVGINTTNPQEKLDVASTEVIARFSGSGAEYNGITINQTDASSSVQRKLFIDSRNEHNIAVASNLSHVNNDGSSEWTWTTTPSGSRTEDRRVERMRIIGNGNVGVRTVNPRYALDVNGGACFVYQLAAATNAVVDREGAWIGWNLSNANGETNFINQKGSGAGGFTWAESTTNNVRTERMRIDSTGKLGIGVTSPVAKLDVNGGINLTDGYSLGWNGGSSARIVGSNALSSIGLFSGSGEEVLTVASNACVGIGTNTPGNKLDVRGTIQANYGVNGLGFYHSNGVNSDFRTNITNNLTTINNSVASLAFATVNVERVRINNNGNVGIGTTNPQAKLEVSGNATDIVARVSNFAPITNNTAGIQISTATTGGYVYHKVVQQEFPEYQVTVGSTLSTAYFDIPNIHFRSGLGEKRLTINSQGTTIEGFLTVHGDVSSTGNQYFANTFFSTSSALSVVNISPGDQPAIFVGQSGPGDIASFYDIDAGVEVLHVGGANGTYPNVGIKTSAPNKTLTVNGEISSTGTIWASAGDSNLWNSVFNLVQAFSATWTGTGQLVANTVGISAASVITLPQSSTDIELLPTATAVPSISSFEGGVKGITYTITNKTPYRIKIYASPTIVVRRGNTWRSNTTSLSGSFLTLPLSGSCSIRADGNNFVSVW